MNVFVYLNYWNTKHNDKNMISLVGFHETIKIGRRYATAVDGEGQLRPLGRGADGYRVACVAHKEMTPYFTG